MANSSFSEYKLLIMTDMKRLYDGLLKLQSEVMAIALLVENLKASDKIRASIFGALGGGLIAILVFKFNLLGR